ncbi:MAG: hypothetical protein GY850_27645 [bacterium]|nr:hypothetical protein [bacterium]
MQKIVRLKEDNRVTKVPNGKIIHLDPQNQEDLQFAREAYGYSAEEKGWFRERDRLFVFAGALTLNSAVSKLRGAAPPGILDVPMPPRPDGPLSQRFLTMEDGTVMRWIDYPNRAAAISDAMDMSLAVAMKIQVVQTPSGGNKISVYGDQRHKPRVLRSIFAAYEHMGFIVTSADLGLSLKDLEKYALPVAPTTRVPMGVYQDGIPSAVVTADACLPIKLMVPGYITMPGCRWFPMKASAPVVLPVSHIQS